MEWEESHAVTYASGHGRGRKVVSGHKRERQVVSGHGRGGKVVSGPE